MDESGEMNKNGSKSRLKYRTMHLL